MIKTVSQQYIAVDNKHTAKKYSKGCYFYNNFIDITNCEKHQRNQ